MRLMRGNSRCSRERWFDVRVICFVIVAACGSDAGVDPPPPKPVVVRSIDAPPPPSVAPGMGDACRDNPKLAGIDDRDQPAAVAFCPNPLEMVRGNGMAGDHPPPVPATMPPWDQDALRDYACAYACATPRGHAYLLGYLASVDQHEAAYLIEHGPDEEAPKWTVVVMYKPPFNRWWNINTSPHTRARPIYTFPRRPRPAEVRHVLIVNGWGVSGTMLDDNWQTALGGPPPTDDR